MLKILRVIPTMDPRMGGPPQGLRNLIPAINQLSIANEVVCLDDPGETFGRNDSFIIHRIGEGRGPWRYNRTLAKWLDQNLSRFDVVIIHGIWQYHSYAVTRAVRRLRRKNRSSKIMCFVMPHGMLDPWFQRDPSRKLKALRNQFYWTVIEKHTISQSDGILFTCQRELELASEAFKAYFPKREINVGYGVAEPPPFSDKIREAFVSACPSLIHSHYLLFLSRIHPKKGVDLLIKAYASMSRKIGNLDAPKLVIAGPIDSEYAKSIQSLASSFENSQILFPGMLQGDAKWGAFYGCDAFVLPSRQENFGIAVVEAIACAKPVLITDQINIHREIEEDGAALVCADNLEGVEEMLIRWVKTSAITRKTMKEAALKSYQSRYLPSMAAQQFANVIQGENASHVANCAP